MKKKIMVVFCFSLLFLFAGCKEKTYEIKFIDHDDTIIEVLSLKENELIKAPKLPEREGFDFIGWDQVFQKANSDLVIQARYERKSYTVIFKGPQNEVLKETIVLYGEDAIAPQTNASDYTFIKWDKDFTNIKSDLTVYGMYHKNSFIVKFYGYDGNLLKTETVDYQKSATAPKVLDINGFTFLEWDKDFTNVTEDLEINAVFVEKEYTIKYYDGETSLNLSKSTYKASDNFVLPVPSKTGFEFTGWFLADISLYEIVAITKDLKGDLKLYSRWVKTEATALTAPVGAIEFVSINKNPHSSGTGFVYQPLFPTGARTTSVTQYTWTSSNTKIANISAYSSISVVASGYAIITGTYNSDPSYVLYCVIKTSADGVVKVTLEEANSLNFCYATFNLGDGNSVRKVVNKGGYVIPPVAIIKEGFSFSGWEGENGEDIYNITKDTIYNPKYIEASKTYAGKTISILGDSITTYLGYIPKGFAHFYPYPTADIGDINQTWWMQFINHNGMKLLANNSWSGSAVAGTSSSAAQNKSRLEHLFIGDVAPDIILIFMGANDAPSPYISLNDFDLAYERMLNHLKEMAPNSEIIVCTLPSIPLYTAQNQDDYNAVIRKHASNNELTIFDFDQALKREESSLYLVDSAHPNKAGMTKLADIAIRDFNKVLGVK